MGRGLENSTENNTVGCEFEAKGIKHVADRAKTATSMNDQTSGAWKSRPLSKKSIRAVSTGLIFTVLTLLLWQNVPKDTALFFTHSFIETCSSKTVLCSLTVL